MRMPGFIRRIRSWTNRTIQRRLVVWSIAFWVISVSILSMTILVIGQNQMISEARQRNQQMASILSRDVNTQIGNIFNNTRIFAQHLGILDPQLETQAAAILGMRLSAPQYRGVYYFNNEGNLLFDLTEGIDALLAVKNVEELLAHPSTPVKTEVLDTYQKVAGTSNYISDVYFTPIDYIPVLYIGMPITFPSQEIRTVIFEIDLSDIWQKINITTVEKTGIFYVISHSGTIIAHPEPAYIGSRIPSEISPVLSNREGFAEYMDPNTNQIVVATYSPVGGLTGWGIVVQQDIKEMYDPIIKTGTLISIIWLALGLIGTLSIFFLIRTFTRPIKDLTRITQDIAQTGKLTKTGMEMRIDEIGQLSLSFDQMIDRLEKSEGRLAQAAAEERNRLARDLHDAVSQTLFSASLIAEVLPRLWERNPEEGRKRLEEVRQLTRGALAEMRTLLLELRPTALVEAEIGHLLIQLGESITGRSRIPVTVSVEGQCTVPNEVKVALYRIAQEALNNVAKHSGAKTAQVTLSCQPELITLRVKDDGHGFNVEENSTKSLGMGIIRERAKEIGASLSITSTLNAGTEIMVTWKSLN